MIKKKDLINIELTIVFYYKDCEVSFKRYNQIYNIKVTGISDFGNIISATRVFRKLVNRKRVINCLNEEIKNIERVYQIVSKKEFGMNNKVSQK